MDLSTAASWAEIIGLVTILGAAIYSWFQIQELKAARDSAAALSLSELMERPDFAAGLVQLTYQPDDIDGWEKFHAYHGDDWAKAFSIMTTWESLGALVHRGDLDFHLVYDLYSGLIVHHHNKCLQFIISERSLGGDTRFEWFTWLAERISEYETSSTPPKAAHLEYINWKPPTRR